MAEPTDTLQAPPQAVPLSQFMAQEESKPRGAMPLKSFLLGENPVRRNPTYLTASPPDKFEVRINELESALENEGMSGIERGLVEFGIKEMQFLRNTSNKIGAFFKENQSQRTAKALNVSYMVEKTGLPVAEVEEHIDELMRTPALTGFAPGTLTNEQYTALVFAPFIGKALIAAPLLNVLRIAGFTAFEKMFNLSRFVPSDAKSEVKTAVELLDMGMAGLGVVAAEQRISKSAGAMLKQFFTVAKEKFRLPEKIIVEKGLAKEVFGIEGNEVGIEKFLEISDKPAFAKLKSILKIKEGAKVFPKDPVLNALANTERIIIQSKPIPIDKAPVIVSEQTPDSVSILRLAIEGEKADSISSQILESPLEGLTVIEGKTPHTPLTPLGAKPKLVSRISSKKSKSYPKSITIDANKQISKDVTGTPTDPVAILNSADGRFTLPEITKGERFRRYIEDYNIRLKTLNREIQLASGETLPEYLDLYAQKDMLVRIQSDLVKNTRIDKMNMAKQVAEDGLFMVEVDSYLHALHAVERNAAMIEFQKSLGKKGKPIPGLSGMTDEAAAKILANPKPELLKYEKISKELSDKLLDLQVEHGLLAAEDAVRIREKYKHYVPLFREIEDGTIGIGQGIDIRGKEVKRAKGSEKRVLSVLGNLFAQKERVLVRIAKNQVGKNIKELTDTYPFLEEIFTIEQQQFIPRFNKDGELQFLDPKFKLGDNVIGFKIEGKQFFATINDASIARALKNLNVARIDTFLKHTRAAVALWSSMKTRFRPEFLVSNFQRDLGEALINLGVEKGMLASEAKGLRRAIVKDLFPSQGQIWKHLRGKRDNKVLSEFFEDGGDTGHFWLETAEQAEVSMLTLEKRIRNIGKERFLNPARDALKFVDDANTMIELGIRFSTYKQLRTRGMSRKLSAQRAADLTVNFSRQGENGPVMKALWGFINPAIQGTSKIFRSISAPQGQKNVAIGIGMLTAMGAVMRLIGHGIDADGDQQISPWTKDNRIVLPNGAGGEISFWNLPYGYSTFYSIGGNLTEVMLGQQTLEEAGARIFRTAVTSFSPFGTSINDFYPTLVQPFEAVDDNVAWHGGPVRPREYFDNTPKPNNEIFFKHTDASAIFITTMLNKLSGGERGRSGLIDASPADLQYLFDQLVGGPVEFIMSTTEAGARGLKGEFDPNKTPFVRQVFRNGRPERWAYSTIYDTLARAGKLPISQFERDRFYKAIDVGLEAEVFDQKFANKRIQELLRAVYQIEGGIGSDLSLDILGQMPEGDRDILLKTYSKKTIRSIKKKLRLF